MTADTKIDKRNSQQERAEVLREFEWLTSNGETEERAAHRLGYKNFSTFDGLIRQARREREAGGVFLSRGKTA